MTIRIFNPDHDLALAADKERFSVPHAGRKIRSDLSFLPALWADDGDVVVVEDIDAAESIYAKLKHVERKRVEFVTLAQIPAVIRDESAAANGSNAAIKFDVWGWDKYLRFQLLQSGVDAKLLPSDAQLATIRELSNRKITTKALQMLREGVENETCGESIYCENTEMLHRIIKHDEAYSQCVVKAPWSSSGRGVRYLGDESTRTENTWNWISNTIDQQSGIMVEPFYNKVKDFGMEFLATDHGIEYLGLSCFKTQNGAYTGNVLGTEEEKMSMLSRFVSKELLLNIINKVTTKLDLRDYRGPFGIDMMIVAKDSGFLLHPCVEINLRRTMGHVALAVSPTVAGNLRTMHIDYLEKKFRFSIKPNFALEEINI